MQFRIFFITTLSLLVLFGCKTNKDPVGAEPENSDPNNEMELLADMRADEGTGSIRVMSRNVYIGADVDIVLEADSLEDIPVLVAMAYQQLLSTDFADRVNKLADEIEAAEPHLIGLQEMSKFYIQSPGDMAFGGQVPATDIFLDFFELLMNALDDRGLDYTMAAVVENSDIELPMVSGVDSLNNPTFSDIRIKDHDAILVRGDISFSDPVAVRYDSMLVADEDLGLYIPRGYTSVNATVNQTGVVFVNTHIEAVPDIPLRMAQVTQLLDAYECTSDPVIIVGDFNSQAPSGTSYQYVLSQGYTDAWTQNSLSYSYNPNGNTFGHDSDLRNETSGMFERIDFIFVGADGSPAFNNVVVVGDEVREKSSKELWPSDHAGIVTKINY